MAKPYDQKPDFEQDRSLQAYDKDQIFIDIVRAVDESYEPKGVLEKNTKLMGIILKQDQGSNPDKKVENAEHTDFYHVYVQNVHYNKIIPTALLNQDIVKEYIKELNKDKGILEKLKNSFAGVLAPSTIDKLNKASKQQKSVKSKPITDPVKKIFEVYVANDFNDGTSYMRDTTGIGKALEPNQIVNIKYDAVVGGVPSGGKIIEILYGADGKTPLRADANLLKALAQGNAFTISEFGPSAFNSQSTKPTRISSITNKNSDKEIEKKVKQASNNLCKNTVVTKYDDKFNYTGKRLHFDANCDDFKTVLKAYTTRAKKDKFVNLLNKGLGTHFKKLLKNNVPKKPYFIGGVGQYTPLWAYKDARNIEGVKQKVKGTGQKYQKYYSKFINKDNGTLSMAYDAPGIGSWLAFHSGFILGLRNLGTTSDTYATTSEQQVANFMGIDISIKAFCETPGACAIGDGGKFILWSAGLRDNFDKGKYTANVYEASYFGTLTQKKKVTFKPTGNKTPGGFIEYARDSDGTKVTFGVPMSFIYADQKNLWTPQADLTITQPPPFRITAAMIRQAGGVYVATAYRGGKVTGQISLVAVQGLPVEQKTAKAFLKMAAAMKKEINVDLKLTSGYRTNAHQDFIYRQRLCGSYGSGKKGSSKCDAGPNTAPPGYSNHQNGVALDLDVGSSKFNYSGTYNGKAGWTNRKTKIYEWLSKNAKTYGFVRTVRSEPWHWEYKP